MENFKKYEKPAIILISFILCLVFVQRAFGQGTLTETVGTMELSQQVDNATTGSARGPAADRAPNQEVNNVTPPNREPENMRGGRPVPQAQPAAPETQNNGSESLNNEVPALSTDTNTPDVNDFNSFKQELDRIDLEARGEDAKWLGKQERKSELAKAMDDVAVAELKFLRKVALFANDTNTVEAVDLLLKKRQDRLNKLVTKLDNEMKDERRQQATERRERRPTTRAVDRTMDQTDRSTRSANPVRRTRETAPQE